MGLEVVLADRVCWDGRASGGGMRESELELELLLVLVLMVVLELKLRVGTMASAVRACWAEETSWGVRFMAAAEGLLTIRGACGGARGGGMSCAFLSVNHGCLRPLCGCEARCVELCAGYEGL